MKSLLMRRPRPQLGNGAVWFVDLNGFAGLERIFLQRIFPGSPDQRPMHRHLGAQFVMVVHGSAEVAMAHPARSWTLDCGDALTIAGEVPHCWQDMSAGGVDVLAVNFEAGPPPALSPLLSTLELIGRLKKVPEQDGTIVDLVRALHANVMGTGWTRAAEAAAMSLTIVSCVGRLAEQSGLLKPGKDLAPLPGRYVTRARVYMRRHLVEALSLEEIAEHAGISASHLVRLFREEWHRSPIQELAALRVEAAQRLLLTTDWSTARIAKAVGLTNMSYLSRIFSKQVGESPSVYRNRKRIGKLETF